MGFFSWNCCACGNEILNVYSGTAYKKEWMFDVVALFDLRYVDEELVWNLPVVGEECVMASGIYNGYGEIDGCEAEINLVDLDARQFRLFHKACWTALEEPCGLEELYSFPENASAPNQGHFFNDGELNNINKPEFLLH